MMNREILRLALPAIISNITTPLLGLVDTAITGHLGAAVYLAAIAVGSTMFSMIYWLMAFLRMGSSGMTAQAYGANDMPTCQEILRRGMAIALISSVLMIASSPWLSGLLLYLMDADPSTTLLARRYFLIVIWGAPAVLGTYAMSGWFLGMQDSRAPMWMAIVTNIVNIATSLVLVYGFEMKIEGVAIGTLVAQWIGFGVGIYFYMSYRKRLMISGMSKTSVSMRRFFKVNSDIFLRTLCLVAVTVWFTRTGAQFGTSILAANALLMQLFILFSYFMDGFAFAGEALAGKYYGAKDPVRLLIAIKGIFHWGIGVAVLFTCIYILGGDWIVNLLTDDFGVRIAATTYLPWAIAVPAAGVVAFVWDGIFIGLTWTRQMLWTMIAAMIIFFILYFILTPSVHNHGLWIAFVSYLLMRGIVQSIIYKKRAAKLR